METLFLSADNRDDIELAGEVIRSGGLVAIPTETVYGLAANALDPEAVLKIFAAKGRPADNPLIVHVADLSGVYPLVKSVPESAVKLAEAFWPGPLTIILEKLDIVPEVTTGGLDTVAVRCPSHPAARAVIEAAGKPLAAPSANPSGRPSPTAFAHVKRDLTGKVEAILDGGDCEVGVESTVISLAGDAPRLLRPGKVTPEQLRAVLGELEISPAVTSELPPHAAAPSPGMKYKHYSPRAHLVMVDASTEGFVNYVNQAAKDDSALCALCFDEDVPGLRAPYVSCGGRYDSAAQAHRLFSAMYELDGMGAERVLAHRPRRRGMGLAVYNRLIRASGFEVVCPEKPRVTGLVGQSGAGKSTVGKILEENGWAVIVCDGLTRSPDVYDSGCVTELAAAFGEDIAPGGALDRRALAARAFASPEGKAKLESIVFPRILKALDREIAAAARAGKEDICLDAPTLFEAGLDRRCARIIAVTAPYDVRLRRITQRDGISREQAEERFAAQRDEEFYVNRADWVIENASSSAVSGQVLAVLREMEGEDL